MTTKKSIILSKAIEVIESHPEGIRYGDLMREVGGQLDLRSGRVDSYVWNIHEQLPDLICKPTRGLFIHIKYMKNGEVIMPEPIIPEIFVKEEDFYDPFKDWLKNDLEECTKAIPLGGNKFKDRWGTPDVIGIQKSRESDLVKFETKIISAEIKLDRSELIKAFGQACAYKLFSHKVFLVIPKNSSQEIISRLDALSLIEGLGLVLYDSTNDENPQFEIRSRPKWNIPDMFYVNKYLKLIEKELFG